MPELVLLVLKQLVDWAANGVTLVLPVWHWLSRKRQAANESVPAAEKAEVVTLLDYLTQGMTFKTGQEKRFVRRLFELGLGQFDAKPNNRYGIIEFAQREMTALRPEISQQELIRAESVGAEKARLSALYPNPAKSRAAKLEQDFLNLSAKARQYAIYKATAESADLSLARDLSAGIPITDYSEVKKRIAEQAPLREVIRELPMPWQRIRFLQWPEPTTKATPIAPRYTPLTIITDENRVINDAKAVIDGEWVISKRHGMVLPYLGQVPEYELVKNGQAPAIKGARVVITDDGPPEWDTKFWRSGGYLDQRIEKAIREEDWPTYQKRRMRQLANSICLLIGLSALMIVALMTYG